MTIKEYAATQVTLICIGNAMLPLKLDEFLKALTNAQAAGPAQDDPPKSSAHLQAIRELGEAAEVYKAKFEAWAKLLPEMRSGYVRREDLSKPH